MKSLPLTLLTAALLQAPFTALAQAELPTDEQLRAWDAKFLPGLYNVQEFDLDAKGQPVPKTVKAREQCLSSDDMQNISRAPLLAVVLWQCTTKPPMASFDADGFSMMMSCPGVSKDKPVIGLSNVNVTPDQKNIVAMQLKFEVDSKRGDKKKTIYSKGSSLTHIGSCTQSSPSKP
jgi:hypothetical protein